MNACEQTALAPLGVLRAGREAAAEHEALRLQRQQGKLDLMGRYAHRACDVRRGRRTQSFESGANELDQRLLACPGACKLFWNVWLGCDGGVRKDGLKLRQTFDRDPQGGAISYWLRPRRTLLGCQCFQ